MNSARIDDKHAETRSATDDIEEEDDQRKPGQRIPISAEQAYGSTRCPYLEYGEDYDKRDFPVDSSLSQSESTLGEEPIQARVFDNSNLDYSRLRYDRDFGGSSRSLSAKHDYDDDRSVGASTSIGTGYQKYRSDQQDANKSRSDSGNKRNIGSGKKSELSAASYGYTSDDLRISKILRSLVGENHPTAAKELIRKLEFAISDPANSSYIKRAFDFIAESIISVFCNGPQECLNYLAITFGNIGYVIGKEFPSYKNWINRSYENSKKIRPYLMKALKETFRLDTKQRKLVVFSERVLLLLKDYLENSDVVETFIAVSDCIAEFSNNYKKTFEKHFQDIVDIVVGWHLEMDQKMDLKLHCSNVLQNFSDFFVKKLDFTLGLLEQFLEDITILTEDMENQDQVIKKESKEQQHPPEISVGSFIGAFNTIVKCLVNDTTILAFNMSKHKPFFDKAVETITKVAKLSLQKTTCPETVQSINEFFVLILSSGSDLVICCPEEVLQIVKIQSKNLKQFNDDQICSFLFLVLYLIKNLQQNLPLDFVDYLLNLKSSLGDYKFCRHDKIFQLYMKIYHEILMIKNVPILQEAYKHILIEIKIAASVIFGRSSIEDIQWDFNQSECVLNFHLCTLSILATQTSSIIAMYALQPSILELFLQDLETDNLQLWSITPNLHKSLLNLLQTHCSRNHNYLLSSNLVKGQNSMFSKLSLDDMSPTSENFTLILKFLKNILQNTLESNNNFDKMALANLLNWLISIYKECSEHGECMKDNSDFIAIAINVCKITIAKHTNRYMLLDCAKTLKYLLRFHPRISKKVQLSISEICCIHMMSADRKIRQVFVELLSRVPLNMALHSNRKSNKNLLKQFNDRQIELKLWYNSNISGINFQDKYFKEFIDNITNSEEAQFLDKFLKNIFVKCWTANNKSDLIEFYESGVKNLNILMHWIQWESSKYCVNNKLRTTLGKPQDTFLKIEALIKEYARIIANKDVEKTNRFEVLVTNLRHAKILLGFLECLEKTIYNASHGTAFAINLPEKPARTFFRVNISTCNEWFNRIRTAISVVASHCSDHEMVIRFSEAILNNLIKTNKTNDPIFEHILMSLVWALLKCGPSEAETLTGLYIWVKQKTGKRLSWIKCAADHASGYLEKAADGYFSILKSLTEPSGTTDKRLKTFIINQLIDCLYFTNEWSQLIDIFEISATGEIYDEFPNNMLNLNIEQVLQLKKFDESNRFNATLLNMSDWDYLDNFDNLNNNFSSYKLITRTENTLVNLIINYDNNRLEENRTILQNCTSCIQNLLEDSIRTGSKEHFQNLVVINHISRKLADLILDGNTYTFLDVCVGKQNNSRVLLQTKRWLDLIQTKINGIKFNNYDELCLDLISFARKETNLKFCKRELEKFLRYNNLGRQINVDIHSLTKIIHDNSGLLAYCNESEIRALFETSKWLFNQNEYQVEGIKLSSTVCLKILESFNKSSFSSERCARMLLNLSEWLPQCSEQVIAHSKVEENFSFISLMEKLPEIKSYSNEANVIPSVDMMIGKLIQMSVKEHSGLAKSWCALGGWYYRWGKKIIEAKTITNAGLSSNDIETIEGLLPFANKEIIQEIVNILNQHQVISIDDEEIGSSEQSSTDIIEQQLRLISAMKTVPTDIITAVIGVWRRANKSVYSYYEMAADAYFKFLNLSTGNNDVNGSDSDENYGDCAVVTATLRLLRLVVKHALGLQEVLEEGLSSTPTTPWKAIIPQLFSRLNHHELYVRRRVSELLCRVAKDAPHLIIFPAVVGASQRKKIKHLPEVKDGTTRKDSTETGEEILNPLTVCFNSLLATLSKQAPETVEQVQLFEKELKRISLLWDEFWLHALAQLYSEYSEVFNSFEAEVKKCSSEEKYPLLHEKHKILIKHIVDDLERFYGCTSQPPETNYEAHFQEKYSKVIRSTIESLKVKTLNIQKPNESWQKIKQLYSVFQQKFHRNFQNALKMSDISPMLANLKNTVISMPGIETGQGCPIYIKSVDNIVNILATKTRPKKLAFFGSDGKKYTYLFKGLEDLHLDERIMQFLSISNSMMAKSKSDTQYRAYHYSVIPLGSQSGLIKWVDGMTPLFSLYKKWQHREASNPTPTLKKSAVDTKNNASQQQQQQSIKPVQQQTNTVLRPSELFYKKLTPLLAEQNLKPTDSRRTWPLPVLRKVLEELTKETPKDLLAKELWCCSSNAADWRKSIKNYSRSLAVMSVIGYVIGLGDRHLDNVLVHLSTGNIVHIDYNVCFEKGKTLRVPERIPFRMTQNLEEALGITGIEGIFRLTCEHVLKTLRKEREILLTLLEAFVYDPLVDWAVNDDGTIGGGGGDDNQITSNYARTTKAIMAAVEIAALGSAVPIKTVEEETALIEELNKVSIISLAPIKAKTSSNKDENQGEGTNIDPNAKGDGTFNIPEPLPIIDGDAGNGGGDATDSKNVTGATITDQRLSRKKIETEVMRNNLVTRFAEIKPAWTQYRDDLTQQLQDIYNTINELEQKRQEIVENEKNRQLRGKQHAMIQEISALGPAMSSHPLNNISTRYENFKRAQNDFQAVQKIVETKHREYFDQTTGLLTAISIDNRCTNVRLAQVNLESTLPFDNEFDCLKEFLTNSAQLQLYNQGEQIRTEIASSVEKLIIYSKVGLDILEQYLNIMQFYPRSIFLKHRVFWFEDFTKYLLLNPGEHQFVMDKFEGFQNMENEQPEYILNIIPYAAELERIWLEGNINIKKTYDLLNTENPVAINSNIQDSYTVIHTFIQSDSSESVQKVTKSGLLFNLIEIVNNLIKIEEAASVDSTDQLRFIPNPAWVLDEYIICFHQMLESLKVIDRNELKYTFEVFLLVVQSLRELERNFRQQIIPNIIKLLMSEDEKVLKYFDTIVGLKNFHQIDILSEKLRENINCEEEVRMLVERYKNIQKDIAGNAVLEEITNMMDFCFAECLINLTKLTELLENLEDDPNFFALDHCRRSKALMSKHLCGSEITKQFFETKKIRIYVELLLVGIRLTNSIKKSDLQCVYDLNILMQVIMNLTSEILSHFILGFGSRICTQIEINLLKDLFLPGFQASMIEGQLQPCETFLHLSVEQNINAGIFALPMYGHIQILWKNFLIPIKKLYIIENLKLSTLNQTDNLNHIQIMATVHYWLNEKFLANQLPLGHILHKNIILQNCQQTIQHIHAWQISLEKMNSEVLELTKDINQRLKWAVGANPNLDGIRQQFEQQSSKNELKLKICLQTNEKILKDLTYILAYEMQKTNTQPIDQQFRLILEQIKCAWNNKVASEAQINPVEKGIVELLNPEGNIDYQWINNITGLLDEIIDGIHNNMTTCEKDIMLIQDNLQALGQKLRSLLDSELRIDVRYLLKLVFKIDGGHQAQRQKYFQINYKQLLSKISDLHMKILSKDFTESNCSEMKQAINDIQQELNEIYDELLKLVADGNDSGIGSKDNYHHLEGKHLGTPIREKKKGHSHMEQKRNAYGVCVWRRIRMKLEGRDPDPNRRQTVSEQVDWMIREARNPDNLAVLYEGWTPWV